MKVFYDVFALCILIDVVTEVVWLISNNGVVGVAGYVNEPHTCRTIPVTE